MRLIMLRTLIVATATALLAAGLQAQQDTSRARDSVSQTRHRTRVDTTTSNGSVVAPGVHNQDQSGVVNKHGASTLGPGVTKTTPTQGAPVTAKGDTLRAGDSAHVAGKPSRRRHQADSTATDSARPH